MGVEGGGERVDEGGGEEMVDWDVDGIFDELAAKCRPWGWSGVKSTPSGHVKPKKA